MRKSQTFLFFLLLVLGQCLFAAEVSKPSIAVINFNTCVQESKYGKHEQEQFMSFSKQWESRIEEDQKSIKDLSAKFEDQEYMDGLSPEGEKTLKEDFQMAHQKLAKDKEEIYQIMNMAQREFYQKIYAQVVKVSEKVAGEKKLNLLLNKEICFYNEPAMDVTQHVIAEMDKTFESDMKAQKESEKKGAPSPAAPPTSTHKK